MSRILTLILACFSIAFSDLFGQTMLLRQPALSDSQVAFVYANDIWIVSREGGTAKRLTSNEGFESNPHFSDDGGQIAFSAQYQGNTDVYVIPAEGGEPVRLTYHPGVDQVQGWTPDGHIVFRSGREARPTMTSALYKVASSGGQVEKLNVPRAAYGEVSPDGKKVAYVPITSWDAEWRNYRGGQAMPIWIQDLQTGKLETAPQTDQERHVSPVWIENTLYYISERDYVANIWSYDLDTKEEKQITFHKIFDIKNIDAFGDDIIYEQGGQLHLIENGNTTTLEIEVVGDMNFAMPRWESVRASQLTNPNVSPNGKRAIFEYRGEILTMPKKDGSPRNLTSTSGVADRAPIWSPKGDQIAWFNDESGEYELIIADQFGEIQKSIAIPANTFYFQPDWSDDGTKISFTDTDYNLWLVNIESNEVTKIDNDTYAHPNRTLNPVFSPNSRYITYVKQQNSHFKAAFIYDTESGDTHQVTQSLADVVTPVFDQSGKYLYYLASTDYGLASGWLDMSSYDPSVSRTLYLTVLREDDPSPMLPQSDEEEVKKENKDDDEDDNEAEKDSVIIIDFEGIQDRVVSVSDVSGEFVALEKAPEGHVTTVKSGDGGLHIATYNFEKKESKDFASNVRSIVTTYDGKQALFLSNGSWKLSSLSGKPDMSKDAINANLKIKVEPQKEYQQIFKEGWRFMRDFLYVDNVHGAPWDKVWEWYSPWIDHVRHRTDLNYVVDIMSGEVAIGHSYVSGGDMPDIDRVGGGLLGADYSFENNQVTISKIYNGEHWNPNITAPLSQPGLDIKEGDQILKVNGVDVNGDMPIYAYFEETAGKQVRLELRRASNQESHEVVVVPVSSEYSLRMIDWVESNRRKVDEMSNGELAYVYVPNTSGNGFTSFNRYYFSQQDKKGVVIDERNNGGGSAADYMIDIMTREPIGYFNSKAADNRPWTTPMAGIWGPKVMIINERAGSGGDLLPYMCMVKDIGPLVGTRTWGGLVGTWDTPRFIDGGRMVAPRGGFFDLDGEWAVEADGVAPDIEVIQDPEKVLQGQDPQLERAVEEALRLLEIQRFEMKPEPAAPVRSKRPDGWDK